MAISEKLYEIGDSGALAALHDEKIISAAVPKLMQAGECSERELADFFGVDHETMRQWRKGKCPKTFFVLLQIMRTAEKLP
jgi:hypothetical protein